jgi:hypothetical protein
MVKLKLFLLIFIMMNGLLFASCNQSKGDLVKASLDSDFKLPVGKTVEIKTENMLIKFDKVISDSRCPSGVTCVWAGEAKCLLRVTQDQKTSEITITQTGSSESTGSGFLDKYQVVFKLDPYPAAYKTIDPNDYILTMRLHK